MHTSFLVTDAENAAIRAKYEAAGYEVTHIEKVLCDWKFTPSLGAY
jgi:hypothetical protein